jgi:hypothetical protein
MIYSAIMGKTLVSVRQNQQILHDHELDHAESIPDSAIMQKWVVDHGANHPFLLDRDWTRAGLRASGMPRRLSTLSRRSRDAADRAANRLRT